MSNRKDYKFASEASQFVLGTNYVCSSQRCLDVFEYVCDGSWCYFLTGNICQGVVSRVALRMLEKYLREDSLFTLLTLNKGLWALSTAYEP